MLAVEVVARFADTLLDVRVLRDGQGYRIGSAKGVDLATTVTTDFPLVSGRVVNVPVGVIATIDGVALPHGRHALVEGEPIVLAIGKTTVRIALVPPPARTLPGPRGDRRLGAYAGGSLVAHLAAWGLIMLFVAPAAHAMMKPPARVHARVIPFKTPIDEPAPKPKSGHAGAEAARILEATATAPDPGLVPETAIDQHARVALRDTSGGAVASGFAHMGSVMGSMNLAEAMANLDPLVRADDWEADGFGGAKRHFDPKLAISETGRYQTVAHGRGAGDDYDLDQRATPPALAMCTGTSCTAVGGTDTIVIRGVLADRTRGITRCYLRAHATGAADVVIDFQIAPDGSVSHARGRGAASIAPCVAEIVSTTAFPAAAVATRVRYPIAFRPSA